MTNDAQLGLHPVSSTPDLTPEQVQSLDDALFNSNPASYWRSRVDMLLREPATPDYASGLAAELSQVGIDPQILASTEPNPRERELQRALDAFALRHHIAESLVRLVHALLVAGDDHSMSVWAYLADDRSKGVDLVEAVQELVQPGVPAALFLPDDRAVNDDGSLPHEFEAGVMMHWRWVQRAMDLLVSDGLDANAGNNKVKHGFAVRSRDDLRIDVSTTPPNADGSLPLSALRNAIPVIDAPVVEFLDRLPRRHSHAGSWESTVLNLRPRDLLAESLLLCTVWSSALASAASRRFAGRELTAPAHPGLLLGPPPERVVRGAVGFRQGLTATAAGGSPRPFTLGTLRETVTLQQRGEGLHGQVVDG